MKRFLPVIALIVTTVVASPLTNGQEVPEIPQDLERGEFIKNIIFLKKDFT